ncbi:hypothetical protein F5B18DRAFT_649195 [Nemania serpens]|nr:hypothetical protein F5B18DRAFT_649195 [Nemania serpens]
MENIIFDGELNVQEIFTATSLLSKGQYEQAAERLNSLLEAIYAQGDNPTAIEILIRKNLALAFACQGDYQQAINHLNAARNYLEQVLAGVHMSSKLLPQPSDTSESLSTELSETMAPQTSTSVEIQQNDLQ